MASFENYFFKFLFKLINVTVWRITLKCWGSGCGLVGKASLFSSKVHNSSPVIRKVLLNTVNCQLYWKEKEAVNGLLLKKH